MNNTHNGATDMQRAELRAGECVYEMCRRMVREGAENAPLEVWRDGRPIFRVPSLYRAASLTVREEPRLSLARWRPHHKAEVHPRLAEVVAAEHAAMDAERAARKDAA